MQSRFRTLVKQAQRVGVHGDFEMVADLEFDGIAVVDVELDPASLRHQADARTVGQDDGVVEDVHRADWHHLEKVKK